MAATVTVNDLLDGHVALDIECLDRIYPLSELLRRSSCSGVRPPSWAVRLAL